MGTDTAPTATARARWFECHMVMDEATSHLDVATETRVSRHIAALGMTRIIVAHGRRPSHRLIAWCIEQGRAGAVRGAASSSTPAQRIQRFGERLTMEVVMPEP